LDPLIEKYKGKKGIMLPFLPLYFSISGSNRERSAGPCSTTSFSARIRAMRMPLLFALPGLNYKELEIFVNQLTI
jgi:hypothetical protein